jgi:UDP-glucose 4-epimerase
MERILVTGASSWIGGRVVQRLENRPDVEVFAVGDRPPRLEFSSEFRRGGLDHIDFARYLLEVRPHAVLHLEIIDERGERSSVPVLGAQALFGAIERCPDTRKVVIKSDAAIYGAGPRKPSVSMETTELGSGRTLQHQRRLVDFEQFVSKVSQRHAEVDYITLRFASVVGPHIDNTLSRYLRLQIAPTLAGFDPRLQFIYEEDAVRALLHALDGSATGVYNTAAEGQLYLSRVIRLGRHVQQPLFGRAFRSVVKGLRSAGIDLTEDMAALLQHGRVLDLRRMRDDLGFTPALNTRQSVLATMGRISSEAMPEEVAGING